MKHTIFRNYKTPTLMGILNITPDSFSDSGQFFELDNAIAHLDKLISSGAQIIDLGGESTRPGSLEVDPDEEVRRLEPILKHLHQKYPRMEISLDTRHSQAAQLAHKYGLTYLNDISALNHDPEMITFLQKHPDVKVILMHMKGQPQTMQEDPHYDDLFAEVNDFLAERISFCEANGISRDRIILDPGVGFGKTAQHNLEIIAGMDKMAHFELPWLVGVSRKRFINEIHPSPVTNRLAGTLASALILALQRVEIIRVHDVFEHAQFFTILNALIEAGS